MLYLPEETIFTENDVELDYSIYFIEKGNINISINKQK